VAEAECMGAWQRLRRIPPYTFAGLLMSESARRYGGFQARFDRFETAFAP
jgi:hypothetical protein